MPEFRVGDHLMVTGYFTTEMCVRGKTLHQLERILGFAHGRFAQGICLAALEQIPAPSQFELAGYSQVAKHRWVSSPMLDISKLKKNLLDEFKIEGDDRLVKVLPTIRHDPRVRDQEQYPPGGGVRQWNIIDPRGVPARIVAIVGGYPDGIVMPADFKRRY